MKLLLRSGVPLLLRDGVPLLLREGEATETVINLPILHVTI